MLRWIRKKCKRHVKRPVHLKANQSCHEGIDFHIYEEVPPIGSPKELAYSIVPLVDKLNAEQERKRRRQYQPARSEIICSLCEKPLPGMMDVPEHATCRCSGLSSFRSSNCDSSDKFSWLDYDCDEENDLRRRHVDLDTIQSRLEARGRSRQPIYFSSCHGNTDFVDHRFLSDDSGGFFDTDNSGNTTDSSLDDSIVNHLDSLDLADHYGSRLTIGMSPAPTPRMGLRVIRRTRSAHESLGGSRKSITIARPVSDYLTPAKISKPVPVCGVHRSTDKSTLLRSSLKRQFIQPESKTGHYASVRRGLQCYGIKESDMGYEPASTDEEDICINVADILRNKKSRGKKCLMNQYSGMRRNSSINDLNCDTQEFFV